MSVSCNGPHGITQDSAVLHGIGTNVPADHQLDFWYGTTPGGPYPTYVATGIFGDTTASQPVDAPISGLTPNTTYYYEMLEAPDTDVSSECSFTTLSGPPAVDYSVECLAVDPPTQTGGQLNGHAVDVPGNQTVGFHYGTTPGGPYPISVADGFFGNGPSTTVSWAHNLTGLTCNTTYYYQAEVYDVDGITVVDSSTECSFTTTACPVVTPVSYDAQCFQLVAPTQTQGTLEGHAANVPTDHSLRFAWGTVSGGPYPNPVNDGFFGNGPATTNSWNHFLNGLTCNTTYYFRTEVYDGSNVLVDSSTECNFTTAACTVVPGITMNCDHDLLTPNSVHLFCDVNNVPLGKIFKMSFGQTSGGPYPFVTINAAVPTNDIQQIEETLSGLSPNTTYYNVFQVFDTDGITVLFTSDECSFKTLNLVVTSPVVVCGMVYDRSECVEIMVGGRIVLVCIHAGWGLEGQ